MLRQFEDNGIEILNVFHCPHGPESTCECRKPKPGMFLKAKDEHNTDMKKSWLIGDNEVDVIAANTAGIENTILVRTGHRIDESNSYARFILDSIQQSKQIITE
jgi:D-glycero-D-manno-heptose 1,7-bisphosphate phosphatase